MANGIRTGDPRGFNKGHSSKFHEGPRVRQVPEEGRRTYRSKRCGNNNEDEDNSPKTLNDKNHQASSQKFRQQTPEEGRRIHRSKRCGNSNKDADNSPKTFNDENLIYCFKCSVGREQWQWLFLPFLFVPSYTTRILFLCLNTHTLTYWHKQMIWTVQQFLQYNIL